MVGKLGWDSKYLTKAKPSLLVFNYLKNREITYNSLLIMCFFEDCIIN